MNFKNTLSGLVLSGVLLAAGPAAAQIDLLSGWSGTAGINAIFTDGNSDTRNIGGSLNVTKQQGVWAHNGFGSIFNAESNDIETANRFDVGYKLSRQFTQHFTASGVFAMTLMTMETLMDAIQVLSVPVISFFRTKSIRSLANSV